MRFLILYVLSFLSAFLMFQLELMTAKIFLPDYGGSHMVWGSCMVFFQAVLLLGYMAAKKTTDRFPFTKVRWILLGLLLLPWLFFPGRFIDIPPHDPHIPLAADVFLKLVLTIGPVFFVLSTMSIFLQVWMISAASDKNNPYPLYAVSNIGSFAGLISYPFVLEHLFGLQQQQAIWQTVYGGLTVLFVAGIFLIPLANRASHNTEGETENPKPLDELQKFEWFILGAAGVSAFMSVNNLITSEIASIPLLWIMPLGIYLLSFVFNFKENPWCPSFITRHILALLIVSFLVFVLILKRFMPTIISAGIMMGLQFLICMYCQNKLIRTKPEHKKDLSAFYVMFSFGGFIGGAMISWIIPVISDTWIEFPLALLLTAISAIYPLNRTIFQFKNFFLPISFFIFLIFWSLLFPRYSVLGTMILVAGFTLTMLELRKSAAKMFNLMLIFFVLFAAVDMSVNNAIFQKRSFYGQYKVMQEGPMRTLSCGRILHGLQITGGPMEFEPTIYYSRKTAIGEIMTSEQFKINSIGAIGLGAGVITALTHKHQTVDFYEIDPLVQHIAQEYFTFLKHSPSQISHHIGDARVSLEKMPDKKYDLLIVDAFSGDAIPFHLINSDVVKLYQQRLTPNGIIMFHLSNNFLDFQPVVFNIARHLKAYAFSRINGRSDGLTFPSIWMAVTWNADVHKILQEKGWTETTAEDRRSTMPLWTDDYSSILGIIAYETIAADIQTFLPGFLKKKAPTSATATTAAKSP